MQLMFAGFKNDLVLVLFAAFVLAVFANNLALALAAAALMVLAR